LQQEILMISTKGEILYPGRPPTRRDCGCGRELTTGFVNGRLRGSAAWGNFAPECYSTLGLGMTRGQQWQLNAGGKFALVKLAQPTRATS
jgi:hypothetical protein